MLKNRLVDLTFESVVIVVGLLIALAVSDAREARANRATARSVLAS